MKIPVVSFLAILLLFPFTRQGATEEVFVADRLLTLSRGEIETISAVFSDICNSQFNPEEVVPYLYTFVQKCERFVLEGGSFPHELSIHMFDHQFASIVGRSRSGPISYSQLAIYLLQGAWRNSIATDGDSFLRSGVQTMGEPFDSAFAYSEDIYVSSAILSALMDGPHDTLAELLGVHADILFPQKGNVDVEIEEGVEQGEVKHSAEGESTDISPVKKERVEKIAQAYIIEERRGPHAVIVAALFVFPITLSVNAFVAVIALLVIRWRRHKRFPQH